MTVAVPFITRLLNYLCHGNRKVRDGKACRLCAYEYYVQVLSTILGKNVDLFNMFDKNQRSQKKGKCRFQMLLVFQIERLIVSS